MSNSWWEDWGAAIFWIIVIVLGGFWLLGDDNESESYNSGASYQSASDYSGSSNTHYDSNYEYNYRTGYSGDYGYNYDVEGYGDTGYVYGEIDTSGKYGEGYIYNEEGDEVWIETEWTDYGVLEAYDEDGNWYELETY